MKNKTEVLRSADFAPEVPGTTVLTDSLKSVRRWMKRAAGKSTEDDEVLHQLRVSIRCALSVLCLFEGRVPKSEGRWFRKRLKAILEASGRARDLDVLIRTQLHQCGKLRKFLAKRWRAERAAAQKPLAASCRKLNKNDRFRRHLRLLIRNLEDTNAETGLDARSARDERILPQLAVLCTSVLNALGQQSDERSLHKLRIAVKRLRYALTPLLPVVSSQRVHDLAVALSDLQKKLGTLQDHVVARQEFNCLTACFKRPSYQKRLQARVESETCSIADNIAILHAWLSSDMCRELKECLETVASAISQKGGAGSWSQTAQTTL